MILCISVWPASILTAAASDSRQMIHLASARVHWEEEWSGCLSHGVCVCCFSFTSTLLIGQTFVSGHHGSKFEASW
jgi:hypothetical protein